MGKAVKTKDINLNTIETSRNEAFSQEKIDNIVEEVKRQFVFLRHEDQVKLLAHTSRVMAIPVGRYRSSLSIHDKPLSFALSLAICQVDRYL